MVCILLLLLLLLTAIEFSPSDNSPYTSTHKTNKNKVYINETIQKHSKNNKNTIDTSTRITKTPTHYKTIVVETTIDGVGSWAWKYKFGAFGRSWLVEKT